MRKYLLAIPLFALAALADEPNKTADSGRIQIKINVGEKRAICVGCNAPICDKPSIAVLSADGAGVLQGVGPGTTLCSARTAGGVRQLFEVEVSVPPSGGK